MIFNSLSHIKSIFIGSSLKIVFATAMAYFPPTEEAASNQMKNQKNRSQKPPQKSRRDHPAKSVPSRGSIPPPSSIRRNDNHGPRVEVSIPKNIRVVAGNHAIREVFEVRESAIQEVWLQQGWESSADMRELSDTAKRAKLKIEVKPKGVLERLCHSHQGAVLLVSQKPELDYLALAEKSRSVLVFLDGIEDPHNLGAIFRTSWLMGVDGVFTPEDRAVGLTATVHKVACGGVEHVPLIQDNQFGPSIERLKTEGYWVFGLSHKAEKSIYEFKLPEKVVWMIGAEDKGLRTSSERLCDELVSIPQVAAAASYNASVAAALALAETYRQQKGK